MSKSTLRFWDFVCVVFSHIIVSVVHYKTQMVFLIANVNVKKIYKREVDIFVSV